METKHAGSKYAGHALNLRVPEYLGFRGRFSNVFELTPTDADRSFLRTYSLRDVATSCASSRTTVSSVQGFRITAGLNVRPVQSMIYSMHQEA